MIHSSTEDLVRWRVTDTGEALASSVRGVRIAFRAAQAFVVFRPDGGALRVLHGDGPGSATFLADEPVRVSPSGIDTAQSATFVHITSTMRPECVELANAVVVPFRSDVGAGAMLLGAASVCQANEAATGVRGVANEIDRLHRAQGVARHQDVDRAYRAVARAASSDTSPDRVFDLTLAAARGLLGGDVAYLSTPADDENFFFARTLGVQTSDFRNLRVGYGEGLGGAARALARPVRSLNYDDDEALQFPKLAETRGEGIYSALAVPIAERGDVEAVMYVASRDPRAYSENDERVLADFASAALLGLDRAVLEDHRTRQVRDQERQRLARKLHDDLIRRLTQIGVSATLVDDESAEAHVATIHANLEECLAIVRDELQSLVSDAEAEVWTLAGVSERIMEVPSITGMTREFRFAEISAPAAMRHLLDPDLAEAICCVGQEAVFNAEHHSRGSHCLVELAWDQGEWLLTVSDNGTARPSLEAAAGHHGLGLMRRAARRVGGDVELQVVGDCGVQVRAHFPSGEVCGPRSA